MYYLLIMDVYIYLMFFFSFIGHIVSVTNLSIKKRLAESISHLRFKDWCFKIKNKLTKAVPNYEFIDLNIDFDNIYKHWFEWQKFIKKFTFIYSILVQNLKYPRYVYCIIKHSSEYITLNLHENLNLLYMLFHIQSWQSFK